MVEVDRESYIASQREVNTFHSNQKRESFHEEALTHAKALSALIKTRGMPCESILDAGCRTGYAMDIFGEEFPAARVVGCDIVPEFVEIAAKRGEAVEADMQTLPFEDKEFDWVMSVTAIEHCPDAPKAASELLRVAKYGVFIITDLEDKARFDLNDSHYTYHNDPAEWVDVFRREGWWLMYLNVPRTSRIDMLWLRMEHAVAFTDINERMAP